MEVGRWLVSNLELETVLNRLVEVARELTGASYAAIGILDDERRELERFITVGIDDELRAAIGELPRGRGVLGELIQHPQPLRLTDVGDHPNSYGFPASHPPMKTFLGVPVMIRGEAFGNLYLTEKQDGDFDEADEEAAMILADLAAIAIENARLFTRAESRRSELEGAVRRLEASTEIARALEGDVELPHMLELIAKRGRAIVDTPWLAILLAYQSELEVAAVAGSLDSSRVGTRLDRESTPFDEVMQRGLGPHADLPGAFADALGDISIAGTHAFFAPLKLRGNAYGVLIAATTDRGDGKRLSPDDARLLEAFAAVGANAIHSTRSVAADRLRHSIEASERERGRWARELHDDTLQGLGGLRLLLSSALRGPQADLAKAVERAIAQLTDDIASLRALISELRPAALDELGLVPAIETLAQRTASAEGVAVETKIDMEFEGRGILGPEVESSLYRLAQEALTNITKHAAATRVELVLVRRDGVVELSVSDDGAGFDLQDAGEGFGLVGMRERVALAGGHLDITSTPGRGTTLRAELPLGAAAPSAAGGSDP
jgi:signal transduction histidine kinase